MGLAPTAPVTAQRVRDGEPAALAALVDRRGGAVLAYCEAVAAPGQAVEAAGDGFARFRREVVAADEPRLLDPEGVLLRGTRLAAAAAAPRTVEQRGPLARRLGATCVLVPELLAARAEGTLTAADRLRLSRHLERCETCREAEERFLAGERAYQEAPNDPPAAPVAEQLLAALRGAAPNADREPEPEPLEPSGNGAPPPIALGEGPDQPTLSWDAADVAAASSPSRGPAWIVTRLVIPAVIFAAVLALALAIGAGIFSDDGSDPTSSIQTQSSDPPTQIRVHARPVTTPLPAASAPAPTDESASNGATSFTAASSSGPIAPVTSAAPVQQRQEQQLSAQTRARSDAAAPPPEQSAPATTEPAFQQATPPPAP